MRFATRVLLRHQVRAVAGQVALLALGDAGEEAAAPQPVLQ
jgi:hypothetical protein